MKTEFVAMLAGVGFLALVFGCEVAELPDAPGAGTTPAASDSANDPAAESTADSDGGGAVASQERPRAARSNGGYLGAVSGAYFSSLSRIEWIQIKSQLNTFNAMHDRYPESTEEIIAEILRPAGIQPPDVPDGQELYYDSEDSENPLKIRPKLAE